MVEKSDLSFQKTKKILANLKYDIFQYKNKSLIKYKLQKKIHTNLICIHKDKHNVFLDVLFK